MTATAPASRATRPAPDEYAPYYGTYIGKVGDGDVVHALGAQIVETVAFLRGIPEARGGHRYAEGKWSIREVIGHLADAERVFAYRAMRFARNDSTPLASFDENAYVTNASHDGRTMASLIDEFAAVRGASVALFDGLSADEFLRRGTASGKAMSVRALAWVVAGHERHHVGILKERYLGK